MSYAKITGTGSYLPQKVLTNHELSTFVDTSDEWIQQRVGIKQRHIAQGCETTSFMATQAAKDALATAHLTPKEVDAIIVATGTPDFLMPSTAAILQSELGMRSIPAFDISAACSGFVYALDIARNYIEAGTAKHVLVVSSERMSRALNWNDRATCVLFGDGAGAIVLSKSNSPGILSSVLHTDGSKADILNIPNALPCELTQPTQKQAHLYMEGNKVFKLAVTALSNLVSELTEKANIDPSEIDFLVPHQANYRILEATAKKLDLPLSQVVITLPYHGNTSAASIPLALDYAVKSGKIKPGDTIIAEAFGAGLVWGGFIAVM